MFYAEEERRKEKEGPKTSSSWTNSPSGLLTVNPQDQRLLWHKLALTSYLTLNDHVSPLNFEFSA